MKLSSPAPAASLLALASLAAATPATDSASAALRKRIHLEPRAMNYGSINMTRDYLVEYNATYWDALATTDVNATTAFCKNLHFAAVDWCEADNRNCHHQLDCVPSQAGTQIRAFTGGIAKDANGNSHSGETVIDSTEDVFSNYTAVHGWVVSGPGTASSASSAAASATPSAASGGPSSSGDETTWWSEVFERRD